MSLKISTVVDEAVWRDFKVLSGETKINLATMLEEALKEYIHKKRLRPEFLSHLEDSVKENDALGRLLAK